MKKRAGLITLVILLMGLFMIGIVSAEMIENVDEPDDDETDEDLWIEYVSSGTNVWRIREDMIVCEDVAKQGAGPVCMSVADVIREDAAALCLSVNENEKPEYITVIGEDEEKIRLCIVLKDEKEETYTVLNELTIIADEIRICETKDVSGSLNVFFGEDTEWLEIDMIGLPDSILIAALENGFGFTFHVYQYSTETARLSETTDLPLMLCTALIPYQGDILIAGSSMETENALDITRLSLPDGESTLLKTVNIETDGFAAMNFALDEEGKTLYYTVDNIAYHVSLESDNRPVPFANMKGGVHHIRNGLIIGDQYVLYGITGELLVNDVHTELQSVRLRVSDLMGNDSIRETAAAYSAGPQQAYVTVTNRSEDNLLLTEMLNQTDDYDIYITNLGGSEYAALKARGYLTELNAVESVRNDVADMPEYIQSAVSDGNRLVAIPIGAECECLAWNVDAFLEITGLSRDELPTDWIGFLELLQRIAEEGTLDGNLSYTLYETTLSVAEMKELMFSWIFRDCLLWMDQDENRINELPAVMTPILQALEQIEWSGLGLSEETTEDSFWLFSGEQAPLLTLVYPEIAVMFMEKGTEYWPLSVTDGGERLVPQNVSVVWINPWSAHKEEALDFLNYYWDHLDIFAKMTLCRSMNEPVVNSSYNEDVAYLEEMIPEYQKAVEEAPSEAEAEALQQELSEIEEFLDDYRENARWSASEKSIAIYRSLEEQMVLAVPEFWSADEEDVAVLQYLDGMISADQFVNALVSTLLMQEMED